ncbi:MAG: murein biosynthesis integral membrane protein MurJ [Acidobacteria bacterium]|nr:murein biosynthesis integral membrane protein MurJ [Acidobacteriota bacterium]MBI3422688.1 murein biosynthesis integral membrane protein MurJ [Acidobacteriota bacterium]
MNEQLQPDSEKNAEPLTDENPPSAIRHPPSTAPQPKSIARSASIVSVATMGSRVLGLVREQVFAAFFGAGVANDAFNIAFRIPNMLRDLFAEGALSAAFVSTFSRTLNQKGEREAWRLANLVSNGLIVILSVIMVLGIIFAPQIVGWLVGSDLSGHANSAVMIPLAIKMTRILFPFLLMVSLAAVAMGVLNTKDRYGVPASASTMFNVGSIVGGLACAYAYAPEYVGRIAQGLWYRHPVERDEVGAIQAIIGMAIGTLIGGVMQWLIQVPSLRAVGYRWRWELSFSDPGVRQVMKLMAPAIIGAAALQVNLVVNTNFATSLGQGPVSWLQYAFRMIYLPIGIFGVAISTATLPITSKAAALDDLAGFRRMLASALRLTFLLTIPSAVGLIVLSRPIIALIYQRGSFTAYDTAQTAQALSYYAIGLVAYSAIRVLTPSFYALKETRIPMLASVVSIVTNYIVASLSVRQFGFGHRGLALSIAAVAIVNSLLLLFFMRRKLGEIEGRSLLSSFSKVTLAAAVMGAICWLVSQRVESLLGIKTLTARLLDVGGSVGLGILVFFITARLLRVGEITQLTSIVARRLGRKSRSSWPTT